MINNDTTTTTVCTRQFLDRCVYHRGKYDEAESFADLDKLLQEHEEKAGDGANRLFYLAIPPSVYADAAKAIRGTSHHKHKLPSLL